MLANPLRRRLPSCHLICASVLLLAALCGCSTPMTPPRSVPAPAPAAHPSVPAHPAGGDAATAREALTEPVASAASAPYNAAVAARFPAPQVVYTSPAFAPGHRGFTTNAELQAALRGMVQSALPAIGRTGVTLLPLGTSQKGVALQAVLLTLNADTSPAALQASSRPTVLLVGQQHGDEPAGSEALLVLARQLASGPLQGLLERINVLIFPRANPTAQPPASA